VLVAHNTDPSWAPLFLAAGAIVVEEGGPLSHAAIVARELGMPAVVNVPGLVARLGDAEDITLSVDGAAGTVVVHHHDPGEQVAADSAGALGAATAAGPPELIEDHGDGFNVFVTGLMGAGVLVSLAIAAADTIAGLRTSSAGNRKIERWAATLAATVVTGLEPVVTGLSADRSRRSDRAVAAASLLAAAAVAVLSTLAYLDQLGSVELTTVGWVGGLAVSAGLTALSVVATQLKPVRTSPSPTAIAYLVRRRHPGRARVRKSAPLAAKPRRRRIAVPALAAVVAMLGLIAHFAPGWLLQIDEPLYDRLATGAAEPFGDLSGLDELGGTTLSFGLALILALTAWWCRPFGVGYALVVGIGAATNVVLGALVGRPRPELSVHAGELDSFPSGHAIQLTLLLGLVPVALYVVTSRRRLLLVATALSSVSLALLLFAHVQAGGHWPTDQLAGFVIALALVISLREALEHDRLHRYCHQCPWTRPRTAPDEQRTLSR
jgi:membrane-associated phospholipid phosphatase